MSDENPELTAGPEDLDLTLMAQPDDELWLSHYLEYFDTLLDDLYEMLKDFGEEDLLISCPITITYNLSDDIDAVFDLFADRMFVNYRRKPSLGMMFEALGDRFFYALDPVDQEKWLIDAHEKTGDHNPRGLFSKMFAAHFCEDRDLEDEIYDLFYEVTDLEIIEDD